MNKLKMESVDMTQKNIDKIAELFPQVVTEVADPSGAKDAEGKPFLKKAIDFEKLKLVLSAGIGDYVIADDERERYEFTWVGKRQAMIDTGTPIRKTLRPCPEESKHWETTENLYIEGDNLEVLKLLQESYLGKVKMIYIDPPYNTGNDFIYKDKFSMTKDDEEEAMGMFDEDDYKLFENPKTNGRFHSDWCSMIYPRLQLARNLLTDDGVIFISIDDNEVRNLKNICDEVFGEGNFVAQFPWRKRTAKSDVPFGVSQDYEWLLSYAKQEFTAFLEGKERKYYKTPDLPNRSWRIHDMTTQRSASERPNSDFTIINPKNGEQYPVNPNAVWRITKDGFPQYIEDNRIVFPGDYDFLKISKPVLRYFKEDDMLKSGE